MTRLAIFDCDGTLVDSGATIYQALAETFERHGAALPPANECRRVIGLSLTEAMAALMPEASSDDHVQFADTYKLCFTQARAQGRIDEPLYPGIVELLDQLESAGWLLAVATGKSDRGLRHCLAAHGIQARFVSLQTADRHPSKPNPSMALAAMAEAGVNPRSAVVIGDTAFDIGMARASGACGLGVAWGYHEPAELLAAGATGVADHPRDVMALATVAMEVADG